MEVNKSWNWAAIIGQDKAWCCRQVVHEVKVVAAPFEPVQFCNIEIGRLADCVSITATISPKPFRQRSILLVRVCFELFDVLKQSTTGQLKKNVNVTARWNSYTKNRSRSLMKKELEPRAPKYGGNNDVRNSNDQARGTYNRIGPCRSACIRWETTVAIGRARCWPTTTPNL
jgi:hypothetical protein